MNRKKLLKNIIILFIMLTSIYIYPGCQKNAENVKIDTANQNDANKIKFSKQGEVVFQDKNKNLVKKIDVEIAETDETRHLGLMFREKIEDSQGMLFMFPSEEPEGFYMKNTIIPLDIIFVNSKKEIVKIYKNTTPFSEQDLPSVKPAIYVVEVNAGFCDKNNIKEGDFIDWRRN